MSKIAMIIPYFGRFPEWFDLYLYSCSRNSFVDFLFYTDCVIPSKIYPNTKFIQSSYSDYCHRVSMALGIEFYPKNAYKLCDLKPFYGIIHQKELYDYDYWIFGDCDLIFGDLSLIINDNNLNKYDFITTHADRIAGHFTIIKKDSKYTKMCLKISNWRTKLVDERHYGLDEADFMVLVYPQIINVYRIYRHIIKRFNLMHIHKFYNKINKIFCNRITRKLFYEYNTTPVPQTCQEWTYTLADNLIKRDDGLSIPYLHFLFFKKTPYLQSDYYWKDDYFKIPVSCKFGGTERVVISTDGIRIA